MVVEQVQRQQWMAEMIQNAQKDHDVEAFMELWNLINAHSPVFDAQPVHLCGEAGLFEVSVIGVETKDAACSPALHFHRVETGIASDVQHRLTSQICRNGMREI